MFELYWFLGFLYTAICQILPRADVTLPKSGFAAACSCFHVCYGFFQHLPVLYCRFGLLQRWSLGHSMPDTYSSRILSDRPLPAELGRVIGIQDHLDDREGGEFRETQLPAPQSSPNPYHHLHREGKRLRVRERLLCMQRVGSSIPGGDIVGEGETAFYAWGEISFRFVLQPPHFTATALITLPFSATLWNAHVWRDLWPVTSAAHWEEGAVEEGV